MLTRGNSCSLQQLTAEQHQFHLAAALGRAGPAVPEVHDVNGRLMPPVEHHNHQYVPQLVAGAQVVQLA